MTSNNTTPELIADEQQLDEVLTRPSPKLVEFVRELEGPLVILGAGGKMGPTLAARVRRAATEAGVELRIVAVSRFSDASARDWLTERNIETISIDLLDRNALAELPDAKHVIHLVGTKFGTRQTPSHTWAVNVLAPSHALERYADARVVALSTGNVYPLTPVNRGGSVETDPLQPVGEYGNAALGRERIIDYYSRRNGTPVVLMRLNYATDLRYGVLVDIARKVAAGESVDLAMGYLNCIWQGDANDIIVRSLSLASSPPRVLNLTGSAVLSVRQIAEQFGHHLDKPVQFTGREADEALLSNASQCIELYGEPPTSVETVIRWTADWIRRGGRLLNKPTHFEVRDGVF